MFFFFNDTATTEIYTLSLHDALPIFAIGVTLLVHRPNIGLINSVTLAISSVSTTIKWKCSG